MHTLCIYHSADLDGHCAGAIVKKAIPDAECIGMNYGEAFPWERIKDHTTQVIMVDFSLTPQEMLKLKSLVWKFVWIDHHKTALADAEKHNYSSLPGKREIGQAGCELTWRYFFPETLLPTVVFLLGRYDVWDHQDPHVLTFQAGMHLKEDTRPEQEFWVELLESREDQDYFNLWYRISEQGVVVLHHQKLHNRKMAEAQAFTTKLGGLTLLAANYTGVNSKFFDGLFDPTVHDAVLLFSWKKDKWICSMYTSKPGVDVSAVAKKYSGGGHAGAAGFPWKKLQLPFRLTDKLTWWQKLWDKCFR